MRLDELADDPQEQLLCVASRKAALNEMQNSKFSNRLLLHVFVRRANTAHTKTYRCNPKDASSSMATARGALWSTGSQQFEAGTFDGKATLLPACSLFAIRFVKCPNPQRHVQSFARYRCLSFQLTTRLCH